MRLIPALGLAAGVAGGALIYYAKRRAEKTGRDMGAVIANLPQELKETRSEVEQQVRKATEIGRQAAAEKVAEIDRQLRAEDDEDRASAAPFRDFTA
ncbi:MAG: hypothetical protein IBX61_00475 [Thermoleophilia bacterium]|nr:hypothetical protein [Thermoleophilia bacterium]